MRHHKLFSELRPKNITIKNKSIFYVDENGFAHDMPKTHGYAPVGVRCFGISEDGSFDADVFLAWLRHELLPELPDKSVVVVDNAAFHKSDDIRASIISCGHELEFLSIYSPYFN